MKRQIITANAQYTGGNIYIYYGRLSDGNFFRTCDECDFIEIVNSDASVEEADYSEFYEKHRVETLINDEYKMFWNSMLNKIIEEKPSGNYSAEELKRRFILK